MRCKIMTVLFIILGILMIISGISFMATPLITFISSGYVIAIMALVYGITGIIRAITRKEYGLIFVFDILSALLGILVLFIPQLTLLIDSANLVIFAIWFIVMGVISIINAVTVTKATGSGLWVLQLIFGILGILLGIFSFSQPLVSALTIGIMIGIYFIEVGITMIITGAAAKQG